MASVRGWLTLAAVVPALVPLPGVADAQPVDPYAPVTRAPAAPAAPAPSAQPAQAPPADAPADPYADAPPVAPRQDAVIAERVALALVVRAQELLDARAYLDAKQLAVEALVASPRGPSSDRAHVIIHKANEQLGIRDDAPDPARPVPPPPVASVVKPTEDVDLSPIGEPPPKPAPEVADRRDGRDHTRLAIRVHGGLYAGVLGAALGSLISDGDDSGAAIGGAAAGVAGAVFLPRVVERFQWSESRVRTIGSATLWGGLIGGLFGDIADTEQSSASEVLGGAAIGATLAGLGGYAFARTRTLTPGDVALVDTLAGIGALSGFTLGMVMQPPETEAYSLNAALGAAAGLTVGLIAGPRTNTTPRRMLRVAALAAAGGGVPLLVYAATGDNTRSGEQVAGAVATLGLFAGGYLGVRLTRNLDVGLDTLEDADRDAPIALVGRSSSGRWGINGLALAPLSPQLAPQRGVALQVLGASF